MDSDQAANPDDGSSRPVSATATRALEHIRRVALRYPESHEEFPWGDQVIKVRGKIFVFLGAGPDGFGISTKLPQSHPIALAQPFAKPTAYGLGRAGWVTAQFGPAEEPPLDMLEEWVDESYRAVAPKRLVAEL
jgi:predicted DNA-binding protein (MmcQ/YjbR family)